jgi:hypothetical protein
MRKYGEIQRAREGCSIAKLVAISMESIRVASLLLDVSFDECGCCMSTHRARLQYLIHIGTDLKGRLASDLVAWMPLAKATIAARVLACRHSHLLGHRNAAESTIHGHGAWHMAPWMHIVACLLPDVVLCDLYAFLAAMEGGGEAFVALLKLSRHQGPDPNFLAGVESHIARRAQPLLDECNSEKLRDAADRAVAVANCLLAATVQETAPMADCCEWCRPAFQLGVASDDSEIMAAHHYVERACAMVLDECDGHQSRKTGVDIPTLAQFAADASNTILIGAFIPYIPGSRWPGAAC